MIYIGPRSLVTWVDDWVPEEESNRESWNEIHRQATELAQNELVWWLSTELKAAVADEIERMVAENPFDFDADEVEFMRQLLRGMDPETHEYLGPQPIDAPVQIKCVGGPLAGITLHADRNWLWRITDCCVLPVLVPTGEAAYELWFEHHSFN